MIPEKESSSTIDDSYDDEVGDDTAVDDDTTNTNFEIESPKISPSPNQDASPMQFPSLTPTVETSSAIDNISSNPSAAKPHIDVVPLLAVTPIQPSPSIVKKIGKQNANQRWKKKLLFSKISTGNSPSPCNSILQQKQSKATSYHQ